MNTMTLSQVLEFFASNADITAQSLMEQFNISVTEAQAIMNAAHDFITRPEPEQIAILRLWEMVRQYA